MCNKPSWLKAPEWAEYLAQDGDGYWAWYAVEPVKDEEVQGWDCEVELYEFAENQVNCRPNLAWQATLEKRPVIN